MRTVSVKMKLLRSTTAFEIVIYYCRKMIELAHLKNVLLVFFFRSAVNKLISNKTHNIF